MDKEDKKDIDLYEVMKIIGEVWKETKEHFGEDFPFEDDLKFNILKKGKIVEKGKIELKEEKDNND
ncbi:MAG: hypothetical protein ACFFG0_04950 [Candidatus Thorarchaeota archaeon]